MSNSNSDYVESALAKLFEALKTAAVLAFMLYAINTIFTGISKWCAPTNTDGTPNDVSVNQIRLGLWIALIIGFIVMVNS